MVLVPKCSPGFFLHFGNKTILLGALDEDFVFIELVHYYTGFWDTL